MLELKNLSAGYGKTEVLHNITVSFEKGKLTSIIGVNGCGKSTLLKAALSLIPHKTGDVLIDEKSMQGMKRNEIARHMAYLPQGKQTPDMTVCQMVLHGRFPHLNYPRRYSSRDREIAFDAMRQMGIAELAEAPVRTLSGGMRQNAFIAMALAQDTEYILLDEPTTFLDISHRIALLKTLRTLAANGKGVIAVLHDLPLAFAYSDKIVVMDQGRIAAERTPAELIEANVTESLFGVRIDVTDEGDYYCKQGN